VPAQPRGLRQLQLFELHGYMRMRSDYFHRLDMGLGKNANSYVGTGYADDANLNNPHFIPPSQVGETPDGAYGDDTGVAGDANCYK